MKLFTVHSFPLITTVNKGHAGHWQTYPTTFPNTLYLMLK